MAKNQKGFTHFELVLLVFVMLFIALSGYLVYTRSASKDSTSTEATQSTTESPTSANTKAAESISKDWTTFTSSNNWSLKIPDGWELHTDDSSSSLFAFSSVLEYKKGTPASIQKTSDGRGGPFIFSTHSAAVGEEGSILAPYYRNETVFKANGIDGKKYTAILQDDENPFSGNKGDTLHAYVFSSKTKLVAIYHRHEQSKPDITQTLEESLKTFKFN